MALSRGFPRVSSPTTLPCGVRTFLEGSVVSPTSPRLLGRQHSNGRSPGAARRPGLLQLGPTGATLTGPATERHLAAAHGTLGRTLGLEQSPRTLQPLLEEAWRQASQLAEPGGDNEAVRASLDELRASYLRLYADAEAIAQSSLLAARPQRGGALGRAGKAGRTALPRRARRFAARGFRSLPPRHRHRARRAASGAWLGVGILTTLPLRLALLIPPRYRERVPLPVARLGLRMIRTRRRY